MCLKIKHFVVFVTSIDLTSCKQDYKDLKKIEGKQIPNDSSYIQNASIDKFVSSYRTRVNEVLDKPTVTKNTLGSNILINQVGCYGINLGRIDFYFDSNKSVQTKGTRIIV